MRIAFYTFGCKVNQYETERLEGLFIQSGHEVVPFTGTADVYIVNSCTVTGEGDRKTARLLRRVRARCPGAKIVLTGCFPQAFPQQAAALAEADLVTGAKDRAALVALVESMMATDSEWDRQVVIPPHTAGEVFETIEAPPLPHRTRAFVKIEDGCDCHCSYCIIPTARGPVRSKPPGDINREVEHLARSGHKEIVLVGINLCSYGRDLGLRLTDAVETASRVEDVCRVRLGSLEADLLNSDDWERLANIPKLCPHFHLSLQSGCDDTLRRMNRHYTGGEYKALADTLRRLFPGCALTTDMIVGFPGESEADFEDSLRLAQAIGFAKIHVFPYSPRKGTPAAGWEQVPPPEKARRNTRLLEAAAQMRAVFLASMVGQQQQVLVETRLASGLWEGHTANYTPVLFAAPGHLSGQMATVAITGIRGDSCEGAFLSL